jgi:hypothetical protein
MEYWMQLYWQNITIIEYKMYMYFVLGCKINWVIYMYFYCIYFQITTTLSCSFLLTKCFLFNVSTFLYMCFIIFASQRLLSASVLFTLGRIMRNYLLQDFVSFVSYNDIVFSQSVQGIQFTSHHTMYRVTENTK